MHYYEHHIGDYAAATSHLSFVEDAAYCRLLRIYYRDEKPLPASVQAVQRLAGARTKDEKAAVEVILGEFFTLTDDGYRNKRADEECAKNDSKRRKAKASANTRWGKANASETHDERNAPQAPSPKPLEKQKQKQEQEQGPRTPRGERLPDDWRPSADMLAWAAAERPDIDAQAETENFRDHWLAKSGRDAAKLDWGRTWKKWIRSAFARPKLRAVGGYRPEPGEL